MKIQPNPCPCELITKYLNHRRFITWVIWGLIATCSSSFAAEPHFASTLLNDGWSYSENNSKSAPSPDTFDPVSIPHTWNSGDEYLGGERHYRRDASWYKRDISDLLPLQDGERLFIRFQAVGQVASVYMGDTLLMKHRGSYDSFTVDITDHVEQKTLYVYASNHKDENALPLGADFNFYGGIYRDVYAFKTQNVSFDREKGGSALRVIPGIIDQENASHQLRIDYSNFEEATNAQVIMTVKDPQKAELFTQRKNLQLKNGRSSQILSLKDIKNPQLWSPNSPQLYSLTAELFIAGKKVDEVNEKFGIRYFHFDAEKGFFLNGKHLALNGINRHQDLWKKGSALSKEDHKNDILMIKDLGCNYLRLAHYQQDDYVLDLCDELGLLVWEEIPYVNKFGDFPSYVIDMQNQLVDMMTQHFNHPSVILWGIGNEMLLQEPHKDTLPIYDTLEMLHNTVKDFDPSRYTVLVGHGSSVYAKYNLTDIPDVVGYNLYKGWYGGGLEVDAVVKYFNDMRNLHPHKPMIVSEYGAGSDIRIHKLNPTRYDFSIEYQNKFLRTYLEALERCPWVAGHNYWCFNDFAAHHRKDTIWHINQKGLVTNDRQHKKDAYFIMKAHFSDDPSVRILSHSWKERFGPTKQRVEVISNQKEAELFHNSNSVGVKTSPFVWEVTFAEGQNHLMAKTLGSNGVTDETTFNFTPGPSYKVASTDGDASLISDGNTKTGLSGNGEISFTIEKRKEAFIKELRLNLKDKNDKEFKYTVKTKSSDGKTNTLRGKTQKSRWSPVSIKVEKSCILLKVEIKSMSQGEEVVLYELDMVTGSKQGSSIYETVGSDK